MSAYCNHSWTPENRVRYGLWVARLEAIARKAKLVQNGGRGGEARGRIPDLRRTPQCCSPGLKSRGSCGSPTPAPASCGESTLRCDCRIAPLLHLGAKGLQRSETADKSFKQQKNKTKQKRPELLCSPHLLSAAAKVLQCGGDLSCAF